jgi:hypothetical protein
MPVNYGHHRSDRIAEVLNPVHGIRDEQKRRGVKPHNHERDNKLRIKAMEKLRQERAEAAAAATAAAAAKRSPKFGSVGSRVAAQLARPATPSSNLPTRTPPELPNFHCPKPSGPAGRAFTAWAPPPLINEGAPELPRRAKLKPAVPLREPASPRAPPVDFVKRNAELSALTPRKAKASSPSSPRTGEGKSRYHGRLPPYLLDRKLELAEKAAAVAAAAAPRECPEGTRILPDDERLRVLELVRKGQEKVHTQLDALPFVIDSYGLRSKHETLTKQLAQLAAAETAFSRKKVIVADDHDATEMLAVHADDDELPTEEEEPVDVGDSSVIVEPSVTDEPLEVSDP